MILHLQACLQLSFSVAERSMSAEDAEEYREGGYHPVEVGHVWRAGQSR